MKFGSNSAQAKGYMAAKRRREGKDSDPTPRLTIKEGEALTDNEKAILIDFLTKCDHVEITSFKRVTTISARKLP